MASTGDVASVSSDVMRHTGPALLSTSGFKVPHANPGILLPALNSTASHPRSKRVSSRDSPKTHKPKLVEVFDACNLNISCAINLTHACVSCTRTTSHGGTLYVRTVIAQQAVGGRHIR
jgi:hypothetical protein